MSHTMKITVPVEVEVDLDAWAETYGTDTARDDARQHVPATIANAVYQAFRLQANGAELIGDLYELVDQG